MIKLTQEQVIEQCKKIHNNFYKYKNFIYDEDSKKSIVTCPIHGDWLVCVSSHKAGSGCRKCGNIVGVEKRLKKSNKTAVQMMKKTTKLYKGKYSYENFEYKGSKIKSWVTCHRNDDFWGYHGDFLTSYQNLIRRREGNKCPKCYKNSKLTNEMVDYRIMKQIRDKEIKTIGNIVHGSKNIKWKCLDCKNNWMATPMNIIHKMSGCPKCNNYSKMEKTAYVILNNKKINYKSGIKFDKCRGKRKLEFDVGIYSNKKLTALLELDGKQHFEPVHFAGISHGRAKLNFKNQKFRDKIKNQYCKKNKIPLLRISYKDQNNMEELIIKFLKKNDFKFKR